MSDKLKIQAADDFSRARAKELFSRIMHFLDHDRDQLLSLSDVREMLRPENETYRGMEAVPIKLIVGSEGRYNDFNKYFLPKSEHLRPRWERVDEARLSDVALPPIQLYEIGGAYFVRDGNHRVSVARSEGIEYVDAEVVSLSSEVTITPDMTTDDLRKAVVAYEKELFYDKTDFGKITGYENLDFTMPGRYDVVYNHILVHKYYMNQNREGEIPMPEAMVSWFVNVYKPVINIITMEDLCALFPGRTPSDLYVWIVKHWDLLKQKYGIHYSLLDAAKDFGERFGDSGKPASPVNNLIKTLFNFIIPKR